MSSFDYSHLTTQERLNLIGEIWDSIEGKDVSLTDAQSLELKRRLETLEEDVKHARNAADILSDLRQRHR
jgi:putative addiction module component (TIGR02574 family)